MTNSNGNSSDRLDRIEVVVESLARSAQAIANDHEERIRLLEETQRDLAQTNAGLARLLTHKTRTLLITHQLWSDLAQLPSSEKTEAVFLLSTPSTVYYCQIAKY